MAEALTAAEIEELERLVAAASPGPWTVMNPGYELGNESWVRFTTKPGQKYPDDSTDLTPPDAAFIAAARDAVPRLLAQVRAHGAELAAVTLRVISAADQAEAIAPRIRDLMDANAILRGDLERSEAARAAAVEALAELAAWVRAGRPGATDPFLWAHGHRPAPEAITEGERVWALVDAALTERVARAASGEAS